MSAGGELPPREPWHRPSSSLAGTAGFDAPSALTEIPLAVGSAWIVDPQTLFRRGLALLMQQWNSSLAVRDAPDIASALAGLGPAPALVLVDAGQVGQRVTSPGLPG